MIADEAIINEIRKTNRLLERIADVLDTMAIEQDSLHQTVEEVADNIDELLDSKEEYENHQIPGFDSDPLDGFPSIRKEEK